MDQAPILPPQAAGFGARSRAYYAFGVLFCMTLLDYMDRNVLSGVIPQLKGSVEKGGLGLDNADAGFLATCFLISYSVVSPFMGWAGDRFRRTWLLALGVGVWSLATVCSGLAANYGQLIAARCVLGIGEATYGAIAPTILLDLFSRGSRSRLLSFFYLAMPIGSAIGLTVGSYLAQHHSWHMAFFVVGAPGLLLASLALTLPEPTRGASEGIDEGRLREHERAGASPRDYLDLAVNSSYTYAVFGMAAYTFAIGGLLVWFPTFLTTTRGMDQSRASQVIGALTVVASIGGMTLGGWLSDRLARRSERAMFLVPAVAMLLSIPFVLLGLFATEPRAIFVGIFFAEFLMFMNTGPCNAVIANVVFPNLRAAAYAISVFFIHFLGDIWSPWLIGKAADFCGQADTMKTGLGQWLASVGALPTQKLDHAPGDMENLLAGLLVVVPALLLSGLVLLAGARHLPREMALMRARLRAKPDVADPPREALD